MEVQSHPRISSPDSFTQKVNSPAYIVKRNGKSQQFEYVKIISMLNRICQELNCTGLIEEICQNLQGMLFEGIATADIEKCCILAAASLIEQDPIFDKIAAQLLLQQLTREVTGSSKHYQSRSQLYKSIFKETIIHSIDAQLLDERMRLYDLDRLGDLLVERRDSMWTYMGLHTLYQRYFMRYKTRCLELPQTFWMRIAMGLALNEEDPHARAQEFYETMSTLRYVPSTPTLFHAGFPVAQLSSCYLTTIPDDLAAIFKCLGDNAQLSKWAGGIGNDWTNIRGTGSYIKGIKATSQGVIPYLKIANDIVVAITRSGIRRGGKCAYLEVWHIDIEDFIDLRRNTGDDRRRTHDMHIATWIPDLFLKRAIADKPWTLFSPHEASDLHHLSGKAFEIRYEWYEEQAHKGMLANFRQLDAKTLWRKMLTRLFETGHPWITFKDPCNIRSPQDHVGIVHSSNLCTEITLNTSSTETAVCNLGSVNLSLHLTDQGSLDLSLLRSTTHSAVRMLDNVIDLSFYPTVEAATSNKKHRPIGLGLMAFQDALFKKQISFADAAARDFADESMEYISYYALEASMMLAQERGPYSSFKGSKWDRGILPLDTLDLLAEERGIPIQVNRTQRLDWDRLRAQIKIHGMRNSNTMAIAPTATISTIVGCLPSIEPIYSNIYVKANVSGEFTMVNKYLIEDLKALHLWNRAMLDQIKYYDGDLSLISAIPAQLKHKYKTAFQLDPEWMIEITAARGKWIDQSQSHNVFFRAEAGKVSGAKLNAIYLKAWHAGLKTTYYLRTQAATQIEKATLDAQQFGFTQKRVYTSQENSCKLDDTSCESCQ